MKNNLHRDECTVSPQGWVSGAHSGLSRSHSAELTVGSQGPKVLRSQWTFRVSQCRVNSRLSGSHDSEVTVGSQGPIVLRSQWALRVPWFWGHRGLSGSHGSEVTVDSQGPMVLRSQWTLRVTQWWSHSGLSGSHSAEVTVESQGRTVLDTQCILKASHHYSSAGRCHSLSWDSYFGFYHWTVNSFRAVTLPCSFLKPVLDSMKESIVVICSFGFGQFSLYGAYNACTKAWVLSPECTEIKPNVVMHGCY